MRDPTIETMEDIETEEAIGAEEILELDDVRNTKGGPGSFGDGLGGLWFW